jgi:lycopene beta-cyclase
MDQEALESPVAASVVVIEPRERYSDDRSWCFWTTDNHPFSDLVSQRWSRWRFGLAGEPPAVAHSQTYSYQHLRSMDFYSDALERIERCPQISLQLGTQVLAVEPDPGGWRIRTDHGDVIAAQVVDTRPPPPQLSDQSLMFQCFLGVELRLLQPPGPDPQHLDLMADMTAAAEGFRFSYVLTFADDHLLAEVTYFSPRPLTQAELEPGLDRLLSERGWTESEVVRTEYAVLPMGLPPNDQDPASAATGTATGTLIRAGMGGGALRPASGFGFRRIQRWAVLCAESYCTTGRLRSQPSAVWPQRRMDYLLLCVLRDRPELAPRLFWRLLSRCPTDRFVRFMDDSASLMDSLHVIAAMPKIPFIGAALRYRRPR